MNLVKLTDKTQGKIGSLLEEQVSAVTFCLVTGSLNVSSVREIVFICQLKGGLQHNHE